MVADLLWHELEIVKSFFTHAMSWVASASASESTRLSRIDNPDSDTIEGIVTHPHGALSLEQIAIRSVVNELNALCEFSLQNTWVSVSKLYNLPDGEFIFTANRLSIEKALRNYQIDVNTWPYWQEILKIKELSEGYKHRQRMQPFPVELQRPGFEWRAVKRIDPNNNEMLAEYEVTPSQVNSLLHSVEELLRWLQTEYSI